MLNFYHSFLTLSEFKRLCAAFTLVVLVTCTLIFSIYYNLERRNAYANWVLHSHKEMFQLEKALSLAQDIETGSRGFVITNQDNFKEPFEMADDNLKKVFSRLEELTQGDSTQQKSLKVLANQLDKKIAFAKLNMKVRREQGLEAAARLVATNQGKILMDKIRITVAAMQAHEQAVLLKRQKKSENAAFQINIILLTGLVVFIFMLAYILRSGWLNLAEKRMAAEKLKQNEERFRALIENNSEAIVLFNAQFQYNYWSPAAEKILGWSQEDVTQPSFAIQVHPDDRERFKQQRRQAISHPGRLIKKLIRFRHKSGHFVWVEGEIINLLHQPNVRAYVTNFRDVTRRVQADLEKQEASTLLKTAVNNLSRIMNSSMDVICAIDAQGNFTQVSAASASVWGYTPEELVGRAYMDLVAEQDKEKTIAVAGSIMSGTSVTTFENYYVRPDGSQVPILWSANWNEQDQIMYCVAKDATEIKKLEKAFRNEQKRFNDLFKLAPSSICILKGPEHRFESANAYYNKLLVGERDIIGRPIKETFPELAEQGFVAKLDQVYKTGQPYFGHEQLVRLNQLGADKPTDIYLNMVYQAYTNTDGEVEGLFFYGVNVSEQVQARKKIEESERNFRQLIQDLPAAVYTCDVNGNIQLYNKAAVELWGREPETTKDLWCGSWQLYDVTGNAIPREACPMALTLKSGVPVHGQELIIERPNGDRRYVMPHPVLSYNVAGEMTGGINILIDLTERKKATDQIHHSEVALAEAQSIAKIGSWSLDIATQRLTCSQELYRIFETDNDTFKETFESFLDYINEADREFAVQTTTQAFADGKPFDVEYRITTGTGRNLMINVIGKSQTDATGQIVRLYGTGQDITERKQVQNALLASEEKYKHLFYQAPLPKWIYDLETLQIMDVNDSAIQHYGYSREEFLKLNARDLRLSEDVGKLLEVMRQKQNTPGLIRFGLWDHVKKDGTKIKVEISAHNIQYDNRPSLIVLANDVTEKTKTEQALQVSNYRWETLSKVTFDAIWDWDMKTDELFWGENMKTLFGHDFIDNKGLYSEWVASLHPEDQERVVKSMDDFLQSQETTWQEEYRYRKACGEYAYCTDRGIIVRDEQGIGYRMIGAIRDITASKLAEEDLRIEKMFSDALLEATPDAMVGFNPQGEIILFNKKAEEMYGYTQEEILGLPLETLLPEKSHATHLNQRKDFFSNPSDKRLKNSQELMGARKNGEVFPADVRLNQLDSHKGTIVITSIQDITQRKRAEMQLKESEKNLKAILSSSQEAIYLLDLNFNLILINDHARNLVKNTYNLDCVIGSYFPSLFNLELETGLTEIYEKVLKGENREFERLFPSPAGDVYYYSNYFPVRDNDGNIMGVCCSSKNITERKKIEEEIKIANTATEEYQYRFKAILDYSPQAILIKDMEGKHIFSNKAFLNLFDLDRSNEVSLQLKPVFDDETARAEFKAADEKTEAGKIKSKEWHQHVNLADGKTLDMEVIKFPLYDRKKRLFGICTMCKDITEQIQHEHQLIEARENAEQAERLQEQFLANMSHELRTPMNGIIGMVNLLLVSSSLQPDQKDRLQVIKRSSDTLLNLINDILDLSKIKAGMLTIEKVNFDFNESVAGTALLFREKAKEKGLKLSVVADPFIPRLLAGDPHRLNQILNNLLSNALKFTDKGFVRLEAALYSETPEEVVVEFTVQDSGIGIEASNLHYIFDNFSQASSDISSKYGGTGLGLAITRRLIDMQGGAITVESIKGTGTTFTFRIPYAITKDASAEVNPYHQQAINPVKKNYSYARALIVEDNDINQAVLVSSLKLHHLDTVIANHGQEAIELLESGEHFDIIFMDLRMPIMNGFQTTAYIRQKLKSQVPIVVLTASVLRNERDRCIEIGASDYLAKPFAMNELARALNQYLPKQGPEPAPCTQPVPENATQACTAGFDLSRLIELGDSDSILHIFNLYTEKMPLYLQELKSIIPTGNWEEFLEKTHKIKGSLSSVLISEIRELLIGMEERVSVAKNLIGLEPALDKSIDIYNKLIPTINQEVTKQIALLDNKN